MIKIFGITCCMTFLTFYFITGIAALISINSNVIKNVKHSYILAQMLHIIKPKINN